MVPWWYTIFQPSAVMRTGSISAIVARAGRTRQTRITAKFPEKLRPPRHFFLMRRFNCLVLALLCSGTVWGAPSYTAGSIVNAIDYTAGWFAPNSLATLFGTGLSNVTATAAVSAGALPTELGYTRVYVDYIPAPLLYVSPGQINFLVPENQSTGNVQIQVFTEGVYGPAVTIQVLGAAPSLIPGAGGYIAATHADGSMITADAPAHAGEIIVLYLVGLGKASPFPDPTQAPSGVAWITNLSSLAVLVGGAAVDSNRIIYAGVTPNFAGLYQINFALPDAAGTDPEIRVSLAGETSAPGTKLALQ